MGKSILSDELLRETDWDLIVIGRGYAAITNCSTRLHQGQLPEQTLLVGKADPWRKYLPHKMGQYANLLSLPGYKTNAQPREHSREDFLDSRRFAAQNRLQLLHLLGTGKVKQTEGMVEAPLTYVGGRWMVPLAVDGRPVTVKAKTVDVCSGPGPGRVFSPGEKVFGAWADGIRDNFDPAILQELFDSFGNRAYVAESYMTAKPHRGRVLIVGEGPLASSCVEKALVGGADAVTWVSRHLEFSDSFPASLRYDNLVSSADDLRSHAQRLWSEIELGKTPDVSGMTKFKPKDERLTICLGIVSKVGSNSATIVGHPPLNLIVNQSSNSVIHQKGVALDDQFDVIIISASSQNSETERQAAISLLASVPKTVSSFGFQALIRDETFVGLEVPNKTLRILGAPSRNSNLINKTAKSAAEDKYKEWHDSLCCQARMAGRAMGISLGAASIAMANGYYCSAYPDMCIHTARLSGVDALSRAKLSAPCQIADIPHSFEDYPRSV